MNIIRRGNDDSDMSPPVRKAIVECLSCGSVLEVTQKDITEDDCGFLHHYPGNNAFVTCAVCGRIIPLSTRSLSWE